MPERQTSMKVFQISQSLSARTKRDARRTNNRRFREMQMNHLNDMQKRIAFDAHPFGANNFNSKKSSMCQCFDIWPFHMLINSIRIQGG
jgi:hypothetical protein